MENLENKKKVLEFDFEGVRLAIQKQAQDRIEANTVLEILKDFNRKFEITKPQDRSYLFQSLIKSINYGRNEIGVDIFYLPQGYLPNFTQERNKAGVLPAFECSKNRTERLPRQDSNLRQDG